jgi:hypothetical protein
MTTHEIFFEHEEIDYIARCEVVPAEGGYVSPYVPAHLEVVEVVEATGRAIAVDMDLWEAAAAAARRAC